MAFRDNLNYLMRKYGVSNCQLAVALNCTQASVKNWRAGVSIPHTKTRQRIVDFFLVDFLALESDERPEPMEVDDLTKSFIEIGLSANNQELHVLITMAKMMQRARE